VSPEYQSAHTLTRKVRISMIIYQITNKTNNKRYIGKTKNSIQSRFHSHVSYAKYGSPSYLHRAIRKYGKENFSIVVLEENIKDENHLNVREIFWIEKENPEYNMTKGGDGGDTSNSPNYKKAIQKRDQSGVKNGMYGKKRTIPKEQLDNAHKAAKLANSCPVSCDGIIFSSVGEATKHFPGISIRKRLDSAKYPTFFRLRPKTKRK
jgi:hypothetical protein